MKMTKKKKRNLLIFVLGLFGLNYYFTTQGSSLIEEVKAKMPSSAPSEV